VVGAIALSTCQKPDPEHVPDALLQRELGLTDRDRVHTVRVTGGGTEVADPALDSVPVGAWVQFVSDDWLVHEVAFEVDSLAPAARAFLEESQQLESPPLLQKDARFVVSFGGAPPGRYPYRMEGNGRDGRGVIVLVDGHARRP